MGGHKMKITKRQLKQIIKEETLEYISKQKDKRKKDAESLSKERKRNWLGSLQSLSRGIYQEDLEAIVMEETETLIKKMYEDKVMSPKKLRALCSKIGMKTYQEFLKALNQIELAQSGKLFDKPKQQEEIELINDENCGNPYRSKETGRLTDKEEDGIKSTYFCDGTPRTTNKGKSIPSQDCGRTAREKGYDKACHPANPKSKRKPS
jgi:hypothetical protein